MVKINNKKLQLFLETIFAKDISEISEEELSNVKNVSFEGDSEENEYGLDLRDLTLFPNIQFISISDAMISKENLESIQSIPNVRFNRCAFQQEESLSCLKSRALEFYNCYLGNYGFLKKLSDLEYLSVVKPEGGSVLDCTNLATSTKLQDLVMNFCNIDHFEELKKCSELTTLSVLGTKLPDDYYDTVQGLTNLKELYVDSDYYEVDYDATSQLKVYTDYSHFTLDDSETYKPEGKAF